MQISSNEFKIMQLLWDEGRPLTRAEILKGTEGRNWNPASIHLILNAMISKGILKITDEEKKYGRTYEACFGYDEYVRGQLQDIFPNCAEQGRRLRTRLSRHALIYREARCTRYDLQRQKENA